jgi:hypothetical protein
MTLSSNGDVARMKRIRTGFYPIDGLLFLQKLSDSFPLTKFSML